MPTWKSFGEFGIDLQRMATDLTVDEKQAITREMGRTAEKAAARQAARDLGSDRAFSGWRRGKPIPADTKLHSNSRGRGTTTLAPTKRSAGIWTTADRGRNRGETGLFQGPGINRQTGITSLTKSGRVRKVRAVKARRWNGYTEPMHTAERAVREMERTVPKVADKAVRKVIAKRFDVT